MNNGKYCVPNYKFVHIYVNSVHYDKISTNKLIIFAKIITNAT